MMNTDTQIHRLQGHAEGLLDAYRGLRMNFALLGPLLPSGALTARLGSGLGREGFLAMRQILFLSCGLDVAKLCLDKDPRTPSLTNLIDALRDADLVTKLRDRATSFSVGRESGDANEERELRQFEQTERDDLGRVFDETLSRLQGDWHTFEASHTLQAFRTLRDKYI